MTTPVCTYAVKSTQNVGSLKMVVVTFTFSTYATNGKAFDPSLFGIRDFKGCTPALSLGKGWYSYDGTTLLVYTAYGTQFTDNTDAGACDLILFGK